MTSASCPCAATGWFQFAFFSTHFFSRFFSLSARSHSHTQAQSEAEGVSLVRQFFLCLPASETAIFLCATLSSHCLFSLTLPLSLSRSLTRSCLDPGHTPRLQPRTLALNLRIRKNVGCAFALSLTPLLCVCVPFACVCVPFASLSVRVCVCVLTNGGFVDTKK